MSKMTWIVAAFVAGSVFPAHAAVVVADCSKKTLASTLAKLDKTVPNTVNITGACAEDVVISGFADLTLVGSAGATLMSAPTGSGTTLVINERSKVTVQTLTINGGSTQAVECNGRSACVLRNVTVTGGANGIGAQNQSALDILGTSAIQNSQGTGIGVYGASSVNLRPDPWVVGTEPGPVVSGHSLNQCDPSGCFDSGIGVVVQDGSFFRADSTTISGNGTGILAQRGAMIKVYWNGVAGSGVLNNAFDGISVRWGSTAALGTVVSGNGGTGVKVGSLTHFHDQGMTFSSNGQDVACTHVTAISQPPGYCGH